MSSRAAEFIRHNKPYPDQMEADITGLESQCTLLAPAGRSLPLARIAALSTKLKALRRVDTTTTFWGRIDGLLARLARLAMSGDSLTG